MGQMLPIPALGYILCLDNLKVFFLFLKNRDLFIHLKDRTTERESKRERENENLPFAGLLSKWPQ